MTEQSSLSLQGLMEHFASVYHNRDQAARRAHQQGRKIIGRTSHDIPVEPLLAAGFFPVLITADLSRATPFADLYVDPELPGETRILCESISTGDQAFLDLLILARAQDKLYYVLKEIYRLGRAPKMPPLLMLDLMPSQRDSVLAYNRNRYQAFLDRLTRLSNGALNKESLRAACVLTNQIRALHRQIQDLRLQGRISGSQALQVIGAGVFMDLADYARDLATLITQLKTLPASPKKDSGVKKGSGVLIISAEPLRFTQLHEMIESLGGTVMAEDDVWGSRTASSDIALDGSIEEAIFTKYTVQSSGPDSFPAAKRDEFLLSMLKRDEIGAIVFYVPPSDRKLGWDLPRLTQMIEASGRPCLKLFHDLATPKGAEAIKSELSAFLSSHSTLTTQRGA